MPTFIDPSGHANFGIGICDRCHFKFPLDELMRDPNYPGLRVCIKDRDQFDPWRLPARQTERITLPFVRPDVPLQGTVPLPVLVVLADRLVNEDGTAIVNEQGEYIDVTGEGIDDPGPHTGTFPPKLGGT